MLDCEILSLTKIEWEKIVTSWQIMINHYHYLCKWASQRLANDASIELAQMGSLEVLRIFFRFVYLCDTNLFYFPALQLLHCP